MKLLTQTDFADLYLSEWSNALCEKRKHLDVLGVGAYDGEQLVGLAGCSADCDTMWQIGIDVLPEYRRQGIPQRSRAVLPTRFWTEEKCRFTAPPGVISDLSAMPSKAASVLRGRK